MAGHMAPFRGKPSSSGRGLRGAGDDAFKLTVDYLKQEAIDPLKGLGRFLLWGVVGSFAIAVGILLILVAILRILQTETGTALTGNWSWLPYFVVSLLGVAVMAVAAWRITAGPGERKLPKHAASGNGNGELATAGTATTATPATSPTSTSLLGAPVTPLGSDGIGKTEGSS
jgi:hypothetical protein